MTQGHTGDTKSAHWCKAMLSLEARLRSLLLRAAKQKGPQCGGLSCSWALALALQQAQHTLLGGIRLCQHRCGRLLEDLRLGEVGAFCREVGILNASLRRGNVRLDVR